LQKVWKIIQMTTTYTGDPWHADESEDCVRIFREHAQIIKSSKHQNTARRLKNTGLIPR